MEVRSCLGAVDAVVAVEGAVGGEVGVPAEEPARIDGELAFGMDASAEIPIAAQPFAVIDEGVLVPLVDAGRRIE